MTTTTLVELTPAEAHLIRRALVRLGIDEATNDVDRHAVIDLAGRIQAEEDSQGGAA